MIKIIKKLLNFIYNKTCYFCSNSVEDSIFCSECYKSVKTLQYKPFKVVSNCPVYSVSYYDGIVQKLIRAVKFHNKTELADYQAKLMFDYWKNLDISGKKYTVIPVPMFFSRARKRKYNHMELVGRKFCEYTGYELNCKSLIRNRETMPQYKLSVSEREENLRGAFSLINMDIKEPVLIIDDISTTGTTLREMIKVLNEKNIFDITCFVTSVADKSR